MCWRSVTRRQCACRAPSPARHIWRHRRRTICFRPGNKNGGTGMADRKVRWGIVSTADIGLKKVIPAIMKSPHSEVVALSSRDLGRAQSALAGLGLTKARAYGTYEALYADPEVDAIYNPLPNH